MPSPNATPTPITPPRVPLIDSRTGLIDRAWYLFFLSLNNAATAAVDNPDVSPDASSLIASYDAALQTLAQDVGTQPAVVDLSAELQKQIDAAGIASQSSSLVSQVAEIQKQIDALNSMPAPSQGTVTAVTATAPAVSSGGTAPDISLASGYGDTQNPYAAKTANYVLAAPNGSSGVPTFRALVASDIPALPYGTGTVTAVSVTSANGFAGTSSGGATPALTLTTSITGLLKGNGTAISAATAGTDYLVPSAPVTYTANFSVATTDVWVINNKSGSSCTATLPTASSYTGRILRFQNYQAQTLISASSNVVPLVGGAAGTAILAAVAGETCTLVSDGSNWIMTQYTPNNVLLLE